MVGRVGGEKGGGAAESGVVDQAVDGQAAGGAGLDQAARGRRVGEVFDEDGDRRFRSRQFVGEGLQGGRAPGGQDQVPAVRGIDPRQGGADPGRGAGDQDGAADPAQAATGQAGWGA